VGSAHPEANSWRRLYNGSIQSNVQTNALLQLIHHFLKSIFLSINDTKADAFQTLFQPMRDVANSQSGQIPFDSSAYVPGPIEGCVSGRK
jgi:hypothetical protein